MTARSRTTPKNIHPNPKGSSVTTPIRKKPTKKRNPNSKGKPVTNNRAKKSTHVSHANPNPKGDPMTTQPTKNVSHASHANPNPEGDPMTTQHAKNVSPISHANPNPEGDPMTTQEAQSASTHPQAAVTPAPSSLAVSAPATPAPAAVAAASSPETSATAASTTAVRTSLSPLKPPPTLSVPSIPDGFEPVSLLIYRGQLPRMEELNVMPSVLEEMKTFADYQEIFGRTAPAHPLSDLTLQVAYEWSALCRKLADFIVYAQNQEALAWVKARALIAKLGPAFTLAAASNPELNEMYPSLVTLFATRATIAKRGAVTRKANEVEIKEGRSPFKGAAGKRRKTAAATALLVASEAAHASAAASGQGASTVSAPASGGGGGGSPAVPSGYVLVPVGTATSGASSGAAAPATAATPVASAPAAAVTPAIPHS